MSVRRWALPTFGHTRIYELSRIFVHRSVLNRHCLTILLGLVRVRFTHLPPSPDNSKRNCNRENYSKEWVKKAIREIDKKEKSLRLKLESGWKEINGGGERGNKQCTDSKTKRHSKTTNSILKPDICIWKRSKICIRNTTADMLIACHASYLVTH